MRIYIVGAAGSGKTTLAKRISQKTGVRCYHLDDIVYLNDSENKGRIRSDIDRDNLFDEIIKETDWIVEDNGRMCFREAMQKADKIILLYPHKYVRMKRIVIRYIKQKLGIEKSLYNPSIDILRRMFNGSNKFETGKDGLKSRILKYDEKVLVLRTNNDIKEYECSL